jgi:hypothetical protein
MTSGDTTIGNNMSNPSELVRGIVKEIPKGTAG